MNIRNGGTLGENIEWCFTKPPYELILNADGKTIDLTNEERAELLGIMREEHNSAREYYLKKQEKITLK